MTENNAEATSQTPQPQPDLKSLERLVGHLEDHRRRTGDCNFRVDGRRHFPSAARRA
jgi:hypothetical protein